MLSQRQKKRKDSPLKNKKKTDQKKKNEEPGNKN